MNPSKNPGPVIILCLFALLTAQCRPIAIQTSLPAQTLLPTRNPTRLFTPTPAPTLTATPRLESCPEVQKGLDYLRSRFNPKIGLLNEAPNVAPHIYWITNDNALAAFAFDWLNQKDMSESLKNAIRRYGQISNGLLETLWGDPVDFPPFEAHTVQLAQIGEDKILQEVHTGGARLEDWTQYADLAFWGALNAHRTGRQAEAFTIFSNTMRLFDGQGFHDKSTRDLYETYKLALALFVGAAIQAPAPDAERLRQVLRSMQKADGGFFTHYRAINQPAGDTNTETTSLAILALWEGCR